MKPRFSHVGIAVVDMDEAVRRWTALGAVKTGEEILETMRLHVVFLDLGGAALELIASLAPDTPIGRFLEKRGPGLHHLAFQVDDIEAALEGAEAAGMKLVDKSPRHGAHHMRVAFLHPQAASGVLVEYCQPREAPTP
jgi:methylmalonyl-CoA/ethylmalonyl-CoA epimerase